MPDDGVPLPPGTVVDGDGETADLGVLVLFLNDIAALLGIEGAGLGALGAWTLTIEGGVVIGMSLTVAGAVFVGVGGVCWLAANHVSFSAESAQGPAVAPVGTTQNKLTMSPKREPDGTFKGRFNGVPAVFRIRPKLASSVFADRRGFDWQFYVGTNEDLRNAFGGDKNKIVHHWMEYGLREGRASSSVFDVGYYLANNADLRAAFGVGGSEQALNHWLGNGIGEGRRGSSTFDVAYYLGANQDLQAAFGPRNFAAALNHWLDNGLNEGRRGSPDFDPHYYLGANADLQHAFGANNYRAALQHWIEYGRREGRRGVA